MHKVKAKGILSAANGMNIYRGCDDITKLVESK